MQYRSRWYFYSTEPFSLCQGENQVHGVDRRARHRLLCVSVAIVIRRTIKKRKKLQENMSDGYASQPQSWLLVIRKRHAGNRWQWMRQKKRNENEDVCDNVEHLVLFSSLSFVSAEYVSMNDQRIRIYTIFCLSFCSFVVCIDCALLSPPTLWLIMRCIFLTISPADNDK